MSADELDIKDENDESEIDLTSAPIVDEEEVTEESDEVSLHDAAKKGLLGDGEEEAIEEEEDEDDLSEFEPEVEGNYEV